MSQNGRYSNTFALNKNTRVQNKHDTEILLKASGENKLEVEKVQNHANMRFIEKRRNENTGKKNIMIDDNATDDDSAIDDDNLINDDEYEARNQSENEDACNNDIIEPRRRNKSEIYKNEIKELCEKLFVVFGSTYDHVFEHGFILHDCKITKSVIDEIVSMENDCKKYLPFINFKGVKKVWLSLMKHILKMNGFFTSAFKIKDGASTFNGYIIDRNFRIHAK